MTSLDHPDVLGGQYDGPDGMLVRVITRGADNGGADRCETIGEYPEHRARAIAADLAQERGGRVRQDPHHSRALDVIVPNRGGRPPVGPMISLRLPAELIRRLDAHAEAAGTTRSELLRQGAERLLGPNV